MQTQLVFLGLAVATLVSSVPVEAGIPSCPGFYLVEKWNVTFSQPSYDPSMFGTFKGCKPSSLSKRADFDTNVETTDDQWYTTYLSGESNPEDQLWDRYTELCGNTFCDATKEISVSSGRSDSAEGTELYLNLDGSFPDVELRDHFIELLKDAFHKSIDETQDPSGIFTYHQGVAFANGVTTYGDASGYSLTMRMRNGNPGSGVSCGTTVDVINSFGALVPGLSQIFGLAGAICGAIEA